MYRYLLILSFLTLTLTGCTKSNDVWEDTKTIGRYINQKSRMLLRKQTESRAILTKDEFNGPVEEEFIPLNDDDIKTQKIDVAIPQPKHSPGSRGSVIPGIEFFKNPSLELASLFKTLHFNTDEHVIRTQDDFRAIARITNYLKSHKDVYLFISGHTDQRASEAYNLALGTRRSNSVRSMLIKRGISPSRLYTISYGKEFPIDPTPSREAWKKNRRVEFKIYEK